MRKAHLRRLGQATSAQSRALWICPVGRGTADPCGATVRNMRRHLETHFSLDSIEVREQPVNYKLAALLFSECHKRRPQRWYPVSISINHIGSWLSSDFFAVPPRVREPHEAADVGAAANGTRVAIQAVRDLHERHPGRPVLGQEDKTPSEGCKF